MARDITTIELTNIGEGDYVWNWLLLFDLPSGLYGFHLGQGTLAYGGVDYIGAGSVLTIEQIDASVDLSASPVQVTLRAIPETGLSPDVLATIDAESYKNRPATLTLAFISRETGAIALAYPWWRGFVDTINHDQEVGGNYALVGKLEPRSLDHSRRGWRTRSDADQKMISATDKFFEHAASTPTEKLPYGRKESISPPGGSIGGSGSGSSVVSSGGGGGGGGGGFG